MFCLDLRHSYRRSVRIVASFEHRKLICHASPLQRQLLKGQTSLPEGHKESMFRRLHDDFPRLSANLRVSSIIG